MARKRLTSLPEGLWTKLAELESYVRTLDLVRGVGWTLAVAALCVATGVIIDMCLELSVSLRIGLLAAAIVLTVLAFVLKIWMPFRKQRSVVDLAATVERANPQLKESLVSCIELYDTSIPESERGSPLMRELAARQALQAAAPIQFCESVSARPARRMMLCGLLAWSMMLLPLLMPSSYRLLLARFFAPWRNLDRVASFRFDVEQGNRIVVRGSDVTIAAQARGEEHDLPETATLNWVDSDGEMDSRKLDLDPQTRMYTTTIPHVMQGFEYHLAGGGNRSRRYHIEVVDAPAVASFQLEVQPPAYTGQPARLLDGPAGEITVFERSELHWKLTFNKPLKSAELTWLNAVLPVEGQSPVPADEHVDLLKPTPESVSNTVAGTVSLQLAEDGLSASWKSLAEKSGIFRFVVRDEHELTNEAETPRHLIVSPDQPPAVKLTGRTSESAQPSDTIPVQVQAADDVGLAALELHYEVDQIRQGIIRCPVTALGKNEITHTFSMPLSNLHVKHGEIVNYRVRAADERPVPGPNETWSERHLIRIDSQAKPPGTTELAVEQQRLQEQLKQLHNEAAANLAQIARLKQDAVASKDPETVTAERSKQNREELEQATDLQEQLKARMEQLAAALEAHPLFAALSEQAKQIAEEEFSKANDALDQAETVPTENLAKPLGEAAQQLEAADKKLGTLESQLEQLAQLERDLLELNRLAANADRLAERLRDLDERKQQPAPRDEAPLEKKRREEIQQAEEKQLLGQQQDLAKRADELLQRQPQLQQSALQNQLNRLASLTQQAQELARPQRQIAQDLQAAAKPSAEQRPESVQNQPDVQKLKKQQANLAETLRDLSQQLDQTQEQVDRLGTEKPGADAKTPGQRPKLANAEAEPSDSKTTPSSSEPHGPKANSATSEKNPSAQSEPSRPEKNTGSNEPRQQLDATKSSTAQSKNSQQSGVKQAEQAMSDALRQLEQGHLEASAKAGDKAADVLDQLGKERPTGQAKPQLDPEPQAEPNSKAPDGAHSDSKTQLSIPPEVANQVTDALEQLRNETAEKPMQPGNSSDKQSPVISNEAKPGEGKPGEGKPGEGKPGEGKPGEGKPGEGKPGEGKPGEGKPGEGKPGEGKPGEGKPGEGKLGEGKPGEGKPGEGKPGESKPGDGKPGEGTPGNSPDSEPAGSVLEGTAKRLQRASQALKNAAALVQKSGNRGGPTQNGGNSEVAVPQPGEGSEILGTGQPLVNSATATQPDQSTDQQLQRLKRRMAGRKWGELPGTLQTEILQASQKKPNSEYGELIRQYFREIAKSQPAAPQK